MAKETVSVVIPVFERPHVLRRALDSVLAQTHPPHEIIIVDDASTSDVASVVDAFREGSSIAIRYVRNASNVGSAASRNRGVEAATGEWIAFLDHDDVWRPTKLATQLAAARAVDTEEVVVYTRLRTWRAGREVEVPRRGIRPDEMVGAYLMQGEGMMQTSTLLTTSKFARSVQFNPAFPRCDDLGFVLDAEVRGARFVYCHEALVDWTADPVPGRQSSQLDADSYETFLEIYAARLGILPALAFRARMIAPRRGRAGNPLAALRDLGAARGAGAISVPDMLRLLAYAVIPYRLQAALRDALLRRAGRPVRKSARTIESRGVELPSARS